MKEILTGFPFGGREGLQVGSGMACRGEVALIVANRGLSMGVLSQAIMTPVVITVVGCAVLTPILLKLAFHGQPEGSAAENDLAGRYHRAEQLEQVSDEMLRKRMK